MFAHGGSAVPLGVYLLRWCGEKENSLAVLYVIFAVGNFLIRGLTRRLRRGSAGTVPWGCKFALADEPRGCRGRAESPCKRHYKATLPKAVPAGGLTRRLRRGRWGCRTEGGSTFFRSERKYQRKLAARRLQRRPAPLRVAGFGLREPFGLSSTSVRCAHPPGKSPLLPTFERGSSQCRAQHCWRANTHVRARSCSLLSSFKKGKAFSLRCLLPLCSAAAWVGAERQ